MPVSLIFSCIFKVLDHHKVLISETRDIISMLSGHTMLYLGSSMVTCRPKVTIKTIKTTSCSFLNVSVIPVVDCSGFIFLCENSRIEVDGSVDMAPIRMPMTSSDCNEMPAAVEYCKSTLSTKPGQKIFARVGIFFAVGQPISPCDQSRHIMFSSNTDTINKQDRKCGDIPSETELFESVENSVVIEYNSNDGEDAAAIQVEGEN